MAIPLGILSIFSIFFGYFTKDLFVGIGTNFWGNSIFVHPNHLALIEAEFSLSPLVKLFAIIGSIIVAILCIILYEFYPKLILSFNFLFSYSSSIKYSMIIDFLFYSVYFLILNLLNQFFLVYFCSKYYF